VRSIQPAARARAGPPPRPDSEARRPAGIAGRPCWAGVVQHRHRSDPAPQGPTTPRSRNPRTINRSAAITPTPSSRPSLCTRRWTRNLVAQDKELSLDDGAWSSSVSQLRSRSKTRQGRRSDTSVIMPVAWNARRPPLITGSRRLLEPHRPLENADHRRSRAQGLLLEPHRAELDSANVRRGFRRVAAAAGLDAAAWTPREMRHSFVSLLSDQGVPIEQIARLVGHAGGSAVTETVYRKQLRPIIDDGATAMNRVFPARDDSYLLTPTADSRTARSRASLEAPDQAVWWWAIQGLNL